MIFRPTTESSLTAAPTPLITPGTLTKLSAGTGTSTIQVTFNNIGAPSDRRSDRNSLPLASGGNTAGGVFTVAAGRRPRPYRRNDQQFLNGRILPVRKQAGTFQLGNGTLNITGGGYV